MPDRQVIILPSSSGRLVSGRGFVTYLDFAETTAAAAARANLWDGQDAGGQSLGVYQLLQGTTLISNPDRLALPFYRGLYYVLASGTINGCVAVALVPSDAEWAELEAQYAAGQ